MKQKVYKSKGLTKLISDFDKDIRNNTNDGFFNKIVTFDGDTKSLHDFLQQNNYKIDYDEFIQFCKDGKSVLTHLKSVNLEDVELSEDDLSIVTGGGLFGASIGATFGAVAGGAVGGAGGAVAGALIGTCVLFPAIGTTAGAIGGGVMGAAAGATIGATGGAIIGSAVEEAFEGNESGLSSPKNNF